MINEATKNPTQHTALIMPTDSQIDSKQNGIQWTVAMRNPYNYAALFFTVGSLFFTGSLIDAAIHTEKATNKLHPIQLIARLLSAIGFITSSSLPTILDKNGPWKNIPTYIFLFANLMFTATNSYDLYKNYDKSSKQRVFAASCCFLISAILQIIRACIRKTETTPANNKTPLLNYLPSIISATGSAVFTSNAIYQDEANQADKTLEVFSTITGPCFLLGNLIVLSAACFATQQTSLKLEETDTQAAPSPTNSSDTGNDNQGTDIQTPSALHDDNNRQEKNKLLFEPINPRGRRRSSNFDDSTETDENLTPLRQTPSLSKNNLMQFHYGTADQNWRPSDNQRTSALSINSGN